MKTETIIMIVGGALAIMYFTKGKFISEAFTNTGQATGEAIGGATAGLIGGALIGADKWTKQQDYIPVFDWIAKPLGEFIAKWQMKRQAKKEGINLIWQ